MTSAHTPLDAVDAMPSAATEQLRDLDAEIGEVIRLELWRKRVPSTRLAEALDLDNAAISRRLRGLTAWKVSDVLAAALLLGVGVVDLLPADLRTASPGDEEDPT